jgi:hypothetical protein
VKHYFKWTVILEPAGTDDASESQGPAADF